MGNTKSLNFNNVKINANNEVNGIVKEQTYF